MLGPILNQGLNWFTDVSHSGGGPWTVLVPSWYGAYEFPTHVDVWNSSTQLNLDGPVGFVCVPLGSNYCGEWPSPSEAPQRS